MDRIIRQILQIDQDAQRKLRDAYRQKDELIAQIDQEAARESQRFRQESMSRIEKIRAEEESGAREQIQRIQSDSAFQIKRLEQVFSERQEEWLQEIVESVIQP